MNSNLTVYLAAVFMLMVAGVQSQPTGAGQGVQKKIKFPEYDPVSGLIKSLLTGDRAIPQKNGILLVEGTRLETYVYEGKVRKLDLIITAPTCLFSFRTRVVSSDGPMRVDRADGTASLSGWGFVWNQKKSSLFVKNRVNTLMNQATRKR